MDFKFLQSTEHQLNALCSYMPNKYHVKNKLMTTELFLIHLRNARVCVFKLPLDKWLKVVCFKEAR